MKSDGSIIIDTKILDDGMEKGFEVLKDEMASIGIAAREIGEQIEMSFSNIDVTKAIANAGNQVRNLESQLAAVTSDLNEAKLADDDKATERLANQQIRLYDRLEQARERLAMEVSAAARKQAEEEEKAAQREAKARQKAIDAANKPLKRFGSRLREIASGALVFNLISAGLRSVTQYFGKALKSNDQFSKSLAKLKGELLTAFQPIYEFVVPVLTTFVNLLTLVISRVGKFFSMLSGKSVEETAESAKNLYDEANAIEATGAAAKKAMKSLAGFDEINKLDSAEQPSGGGGGGTAIKPVFDTSSVYEDLGKIADLIFAIGAGLLAWKISRFFTDSLKTAAGIGIAVGGAFLYGANMADAFTNGINWDNLSGMLLGLVAVVGGLGLAFGVTAAAVALLIGGIGLVIVSFNEWMTTGELSTEACAALTAGIVAIGAAISLLTGSWIPLIIAAVAGLVFAIATKGDEIKGLLQKLDDWLQGVFEKDWTELFGPVLGSVLNGFFGVVKNVWSGVKQILDGIIDFVGAVFKGDWQKAWDSVVGIFKGAWETLGAIFQPVIDAIAAAWEWLGNLLPDTWKNAINAIVKVVNKFTSWLNDTLSFYIPPINIAGVSIFGGGSVSLVNIPQIPYLAQGAVIPPNAPFMAMLGDQKHGTNIEAPLSTIQEAVANVMRDNIDAMMQGFEALLQENRQLRETVEGIEVGDKVIADAVQRYNSRMAVVRGG